MSYVEVTNVSWFGKMKNAIGGVVIGAVMFIAAFPLLFWNEGRAVKTAKSIKEVGGAVVSVSAEKVDPAYEGKLVHVQADAKTEEMLTDAEFGVSLNAIKLTRKVEMYQWKEKKETKTRKKIGGGDEQVTTYEYTRDWDDDVNDSSQFHDPQYRGRNPGSKPYPDKDSTATKVHVGAFGLNPNLIGKINNFEDLAVTQEMAAKLPAEAKAKLKVSGSMFCTSKDPAAPEIGDVRVKFQAAKPGPVSIIARQVRDTFEPYKTGVGKLEEWLMTGVHSAEAMVQRKEAENKMFTWILRVVGFFLMFVGLILVFNPIKVFGDVIPFVGSLLGAGIAVFAGLAAFGLSMITIAIGWVFYRPLLGIPLLLVGLGAIILLAKMGKRKGPSPVAPPPQA